MITLPTLATPDWPKWVLGAALTGVFMAGQMTAASADDAWNPFAEQDRRAARKAERGRRRQPQRPIDTRPYLAPVSPPYGNSRPPQPYPATPPAARGYGAYQPPGTGDAGVPGSVPYGAPGTYIPAPSAGTPNVAAHTSGVERGQLTPLISGKTALPAGTWQGLDAASVEQLLGPATLPPASAALNALLERVMAEKVSDRRLDAARIAALLRAGRFQQAARLRQQAGSTASEHRALIDVKLDLASGATDAGCSRVKEMVAAPDKLPRAQRGEAIVLAGYCAIVAGNRQAGELAAELARDAGYNRPFVLELLTTIANGDAVRAAVPQRVSLLDALLVQQLKEPDATLVDGMLERADAGFLALIAGDPNAAPSLRLAAAERAAGAHILPPAALADAYRAAAGAPTGRSNAAQDRAQLFATAERNRAQFARTRAIRSLLDSARRDGLYEVVGAAVVPLVRQLRPAQEISWFTETAIEVLAAGADYGAAREWVRADTAGRRGPSSRLDHWLALLDIADPELPRGQRGRSLGVLENLALQGRFSPATLHRLATVLDALDYNVPVPLWNLASRTQQPQTGHLPATGMLSAMKTASEAGQVAATTLYAIRTIAPAGVKSTHLLGLGETIRALKKAGLTRTARRLGFEALFVVWPRSAR